MKRAKINQVWSLIFLLSVTCAKASDVLNDQALLKYRQRMEAAPKFFSLEDRMKLREELMRRNLGTQSLYDNNQATYHALQGMQRSIQQSATKKKVAGMFKTTIRTGMFAASTAAAVGSLGSAAPVVSVVNGGLGLVIDPVFKSIEESIQKGHESAMRAHFAAMPRGTLKSREEAVASLKQMFGNDVLLSDLPAPIQSEVQKNPGVFATYQRERNARLDAFLAKVGEDVLDLQGQTFEHGVDIAELKKQTAATSIFLTQFAMQTRGRLENLERSQGEAAQAMDQFRSILNKQSINLEQNTKDINAMKEWMAGKMTNAELVAAAKSGLISISEKQLNQISLIAKVEAFQQNATHVLNVAGDMLAVAEKFGMNPKLVAKISKGIAYSQAGVGIATSIASGNYFAAVSIVTSFFSGPDPATQRHEQIMKTLGEIYNLQVEILKNQATLSKQIEEVQSTLLNARQAIMDRLDTGFNRVDINLASIAGLLTEVATTAKLNSCADVSMHYGEEMFSNPREMNSEAGISNFFSTERYLLETRACRDSLFKIFFEEEFLGDLRPASKPNALLAHGVTTDRRRTADVDRSWNADQDFYALMDVLETFNDLDSNRNPSIDQIFWGLQAETGTINAALQRAQIAATFKETNEFGELFHTRMQPEVVAKVASQLRKLFPLFNRVSKNGFLSVNDLDPDNAQYRSNRSLNLLLARTALQVTKAAEAQERLISGSFVIPQLIQFMRQPKTTFQQSPHPKRDEVVLQTARTFAKVFQHNPYLSQNAALTMIAQISDIRMGFDRVTAINEGRLEVPAMNTTFSAQYKKAYASGNVDGLRTLLPRDWKVMCAEDLSTERAHRWVSTFDPRLSCRADHHGKFAYAVRMRGFDELLDAEKTADPALDIVFSLPDPEAVIGEYFAKSPALLKLEDESAAIEALILNNQNLSHYSDASLRAFDQTVLGPTQ